MKHQLTKMMGVLALVYAPMIVLGQQSGLNAGKSPGEEKASTGNGTSNDPMTLATYFRNLAFEVQQLAESHEETAALYKQSMASLNLDPSQARDQKNQYQQLAEIEAKAAKAAGNLAEYYSRLAELLSRTFETPRHERFGDAAFRK